MLKLEKLIQHYVTESCIKQNKCFDLLYDLQKCSILVITNNLISFIYFVTARN